MVPRHPFTETPWVLLWLLLLLSRLLLLLSRLLLLWLRGRTVVPAVGSKERWCALSLLACGSWSFSACCF